MVQAATTSSAAQREGSRGESKFLIGSLGGSEGGIRFFLFKETEWPGLWPAWSNYKVFKRELTGRHPSCTPTTVLPRTVGRRVLVARQPLPTMAAVLNPPAVPNKKAKKAKPAQKATNWAAFGFKKDVGYTPAKIRDDLPTELPVMKKSGATPWRPGTSSSPKTPSRI